MFRHKSLGLLSGMLIAPRMAARLASKAPGMLEGNSSAQHMLGQATHGLMYAFMIAMPVRENLVYKTNNMCSSIQKR